jgi:hypothetical protein
VEQDKHADTLQAGASCRLAVGVFDAPHDLENAMVELSSGGFTAREICLAGKRQVLDRVLRGPLQSSMQYEKWPPSQRAFSLRRLGVEGGDGEYVATSRGVLKTLLDQSKTTKAAPAPSASFWPDLCHRMVVHMRRDAIVLLVCAKDAALQNRSSRILLRHSTQSVQTYEFTPPR